MKNRIAITVTVLALLGCVAGLAWTIHSVWPTDAEPETVEPNFIAHQDGEPDDTFSFDDVEVGPLPGQAKAEDKAPEPDPPKKKTRKPVVTKKRPQKRDDWKPAVLQIITNFDSADVKVNGITYPEYVEPGQPEGMVLPAGGPYNVDVTYGDNLKQYRLHLRPYETRLLMVDLTGFNSSAPPPPPPKADKPAKKEEKKEEKKDDDKKQGKITVYSKPAGVVVVDGKDTGEKTPGSVELENGRHEVQVKYETGSISEKKIVRVRSGSRIKLFFRERK